MYPPCRAKSIFRKLLLGGGDLEVGVVHLVVIDRILMSTNKQRSSTFLTKKVKVHRRQNPGYAPTCHTEL